MERPAAVAALVIHLVWVVSVFVARPLVLRARTGDAGFRPLAGRRGAARWGGVLFVLAVLLGTAAPIAALSGLPRLPRLPGPDGPALAVVGLVVASGGAAGAAVAQLAMGTAWRVGVDPGEGPGLVTGGAFRRVRNPFFAATLGMAAGLVLLVPNLLAVAAASMLLAAVEIQVRGVEEPYLLHRYGEAYRAYCRGAGRFVPGIGRRLGAAASRRPR